MVTSDQSRVSTAPSSWADPAISAPRGSRWRRVLPLVLWMTCLVVAVVLLRALGGGRLAAPPLTSPGSWAAWAGGRDPLEVVMVVLRLLALGLAWYLTGATSISVVARLLRAARLVRIADALSFGPVKVLVQQAVGIGLAASVLTTVVPAPPGPTGSHAADQGDPAGAAVAVLVPMPFAAPGGGAGSGAGPTTGGASVALAAQQSMTSGASEAIVPVPAPAPASTTTTEEPTDVAPHGTTDEPTDDRDGAARREVRVEPGDHFWAIAEADVARHLGRPGTDHEVIAHWQAILEANADRLPVAGNPDILLPGQMVLLPRVAEVHA